MIGIRRCIAVVLGGFVVRNERLLVRKRNKGCHVSPLDFDEPWKSHMKGPPLSAKSNSHGNDQVLVRYMYDGSVLSQGRICFLQPKHKDKISAVEVLQCLVDDGVCLERFYACLYETKASKGGWLPLLRNMTHLCSNRTVQSQQNYNIDIPLPQQQRDDDGDSAATTTSRRIDVKLMRRNVQDNEIQEEPAFSGKLPPSNGYHGIGVVNIKTQANVGTLWRSAFQLGSSFLFTVGSRYKHQATDTVGVLSGRLPFFELDDWADFCKFCPRGAKWVAIEMGGIPIQDFDHPKNAVYILGSEDVGLPNSIVRACHEVVSIDSERYASYNVAMAGTIVLYDRLVKTKERRKKAQEEQQADG